MAVASPRILIFDLDGTLVDTMGPAADLFCEMLLLEHMIPRHLSLPTVTQLMGKGPKAQFAAVLGQLELLDESLLEDLIGRYWMRAEEYEPKIFPEVIEVLEELRRDGHTLVVSSGSIPSSVVRKVRVTGIERFCRLVLGSEEGVPGLTKGPGHFALIAEALRITDRELTERGVFVGDGVYDMQIAVEAGMVGVGRLTGENAELLRAAGAHEVIHNLRDLQPLLATL